MPTTIARRRRAAGLLEVLLGSGILLALVGVQLLLFQSGSSTWHKADSQAELLQNLQVGLGRMSREIQSSTLESLTVAPGGVACLSAQPYQVNNTGQLLWRSYLVFYHDAATAELRFVSHDLVAPDDTPQRIERYNFGSGLHPVAYYFSAGRRVSGFVSNFTATIQGRCLEVELEGTRKRYGNRNPEHVVLRQNIFLRN